MKIRMYYESKLDRDTVILEVPEGEFEIMIENDYRQRLEKARPEDKDRIQRRDPQTIIDEEFNKPGFNRHHTETRRHMSLDALDPEGGKMSGGTNTTGMIFSDDVESLRQAVGKLLPEQKELLRKVFCENMSQREIARNEGVSETAIGRRLARIYKRLREEIERQG